MKTNKKWGAVALSMLLALGLTVAGVGTAFADPTSGDTNVQLIADEENIDVTLPADFVAAIAGDGTLTYPTNNAITNNSLFDIHVSNIEVTEAGIYSLASSTGFAPSSADTLWTTVTPGTGTAIDLFNFKGGSVPTQAEWSMSKAGDATPAIDLTFAGEIANLTTVPTTATAAYTITWTVAAG